jgi:aconitate decarboxylase
VTVTAELCERIVGTPASALGPAATEAARRLVLDGLAVGVAGSGEPAVALLVDHHRAQEGAARATVLGRGCRLGTVAAAEVNGAAMHVLDFEPMWSPANHALSTTLPVVLALGETIDAPGRELVAAMVKGIELQGWIRQASRQWEAGELRFHPPGVAGPLGAAVAAGHLLALDPGGLRHALGIAASRSGGLMANVGTMTKSRHCGAAAAAGLEAAMLAARGFTADPDIFDAAGGLPDAFFPGFVGRDLLGFGPPFRVVEPGYALKLFPCQFGTHFGITAALAAHRRIGDPGLVRAVRLTAPVMAYVDRPRPATGLAGKFSLQYTVAVALLDGTVGLGSFTDERLARPDLQRLLAATELIMSPDIPARFEAMHVVLEVDLHDGRTITQRCDGPHGVWGSPPVSDAEHRAKLVDCLERVLPAVDTERVIELAGRIDTLENDQVRELIGLVGTGPTRSR